MIRSAMRLRSHGAVVALLIALFALVLLAQHAKAASHCVNPAGSGGCFASIQAAIDDAGTVDGDTIAVAPNNPLQTTYQEHITVGKNVTIIGTDATTTIVDGTNNGTTFTINVGKTVSISGVTITTGSPLTIDNGGTLTLTNDTLTIYGNISNRDTGTLTLTNVAGNGGTIVNGAGIILVAGGNFFQVSFVNGAGAMMISNATVGGLYYANIRNGTGTLVMRSVTIGNGGEIYNNDVGEITVADSTLGANIINYSSGTVTVTNSARIAIDNRGTGTVTVIGGSGVSITNAGVGAITVSGTAAMPGIRNSSTGTVTLTNSRVTGRVGVSNAGTVRLINSTVDHSTADHGGGIYNKGVLSLTDSSVDHNTASNTSAVQGGGGIYNDTGGTATLINSTLNGNTTGGSIGGGVLNLGTMRLINTTIAGNNAPQGGGIANYATLTMANTIVASNTASGGGPDILGSVTSNGHNLIGTMSGASGFVSSDLTNVNAQLGPFQGNGGPSWTMALSNNSPAIGAGDTAICATMPPDGAGGKDQRGLARSASSCSIGAYEALPALPKPVPASTRSSAPTGGSAPTLPMPRTNPVGIPGNGPTPKPLPPHR